MLLKDEREQIVLYGQKMIQNGLTKGTGGNLSIYNREQQLMAISPSGIDYLETRLEDVVILSLDGHVVEGNHQPSSEFEMHRIFYLKRTDIHAIVHTHSPFASTISALQIDLPAASYLTAYAGKNVRCSEYATFGTKELAEKAYAGMKNRYAVLLANHGLLAGAGNIHRAFHIAEEIEYCAEIFVRARSIGDPVIIPDNEMDRLVEKFKTYGA
ncbi:L-fuculose 1-phosphate aldolase [Seinonella peptonophila]|uniref:L-fuculose 1-phosphate aldolase n=1 Tax=Seinonella peptonophila TaxID=112248 RepID=A0A1M4ZGM7_9BACL|nr:L-fuculose-phosphate aldolase [Seinonella peptonophila]SHF17161.1 L-fuculose 1-phosphate aldolase [Seinonella peptonophila]